MQLDDTDRRILRHYLAEPALPRADLADRAGVTPATLWRRLDRLREGGVILFHISNRFVDLQPALSRLAQEEKLHARLVTDVPEGSEDEESPLLESDWVIMAADEKWFAFAEMEKEGEPLKAPKRGPAWTDDFNNILSAIRLGGSSD